MEHLQLDAFMPYKPQAVIVVYNKSNDLYLEHRDVVSDPQKPGYILTSGKPMSKNFLRSLYSMFKDSNEHTLKREVIDRRILFYSVEERNIFAVWYLPSTIRNIYFEDSMNIPSGPIVIPNLVFVFDHGSIKTYCYKDDLFDYTKELYYSPFMNTGEYGNVCMPRYTIPKLISINNLIKSVEELFFFTKFTHPSTKHYDYHNLWRDSMKEGIFTGELISCKKTLSQIIEKRSTSSQDI